MTILNFTQMKVTGVMVSRIRSDSYDEPHLHSDAFFLSLLDAEQGWKGRSVSIEDLYNRVSINDDQRFDCHILGSADHPTGTALC